MLIKGGPLIHPCGKRWIILDMSPRLRHGIVGTQCGGIEFESGLFAVHGLDWG
jgi:hypothetical protein